MRCLACDRALSDYESTRKVKETGAYLDLCSKCFNSSKSSLTIIDRPDLDKFEEDEFEGDYLDLSGDWNDESETET